LKLQQENNCQSWVLRLRRARGVIKQSPISWGFFPVIARLAKPTEAISRKEALRLPRLAGNDDFLLIAKEEIPSRLGCGTEFKIKGQKLK
jgi:hypothetical protein